MIKQDTEMTSRELYEEYVAYERDCIEHKRYMLNNEKCYLEWCEENGLNPEE